MGEQFDIVYTSWGTVVWLADLQAWARNIAQLLTPGGWFYFADTHPVLNTAEVVDGALQFRRPYGDNVLETVNDARSYTDRSFVNEHTRAHFFAHSVGEIVTALADNGLKLEFLRERPILNWQHNELMVRGDDGYWRQPDCTLPLSLSLRAIAP